MKAFTTLLFLAALVALSPAPIFDRHAPRQIAPEMTQQQREAQLGSQRVGEVVGSVPTNTRSLRVAVSANDDAAASVVRFSDSDVQSSGQQKQGAGSEPEQSSTKKSPVSLVLWLAGACCAAYGLTQVAKRGPVKKNVW
jgi:hypothetical protein